MVADLVKRIVDFTAAELPPETIHRTCGGMTEIAGAGAFIALP